jgi:multiple sugar transport system substrate-binding protein
MVCDSLSCSSGSPSRRHTGGTTRRRFLQSAGVAGTAGLSGCTGFIIGGNTPTHATRIKFWTLFSGGDGQAMKALVEKFNDEHDDIFIERQRIPWGEYYRKMYTSLTSRTAPDIAISHASRLRMLSDYLIPFEDTDLSQYLDVIHEHLTYDDELLALPLDIHAVAHYYNKEIFEEAGLDPENPPTNWEEFKPAMDTIIQETPYSSYDPGADGFLFRTWLSWVASANEQFLKNEATTPTPAFNTARVTELTRPFDAMVSKWNWTTKSGLASYDAFNTGNHAVTMDGTWAYARYKESADNIDFDWGVFTVSTGRHKRENVTEGDSHTIVVPWNPNRSKEKEQAARTAARWLSTHPYWPLNTGHIPSTLKTYNSNKLRSSKLWDRTMHLFAKQAKNGNVRYEPATEHNTEYRRIIQQALMAIRTQNKSTEQALADAESQLNRVFSL